MRPAANQASKEIDRRVAFLFKGRPRRGRELESQLALKSESGLAAKQFLHMKTYFPSHLVQVSRDLDNILMRAEVESKWPDWDQAREGISQSLQRIATQCESMALRVTLSYARECLAELSFAPRPDWKGKVDIFGKIFEHEIGLISLFGIPADKLALYSDATPFDGKNGSGKVSERFPKASGEAVRAAKCLAVGQQNASVFHLTRVLEIAFRALSRGLTMPDPMRDKERNWANMLSRVKQQIDSNATANPPVANWAADKNFYESAYAALEALRNSWRNAAVYVEADYSEDEARQIFEATKSLMRHLATRLKE
jgi:hypothetical protein